MTSRYDTRWLLAAGFGGLLLLMAFAGLDAVRILWHLRSQNDVIRTEFLARNRLLNEIRSNVYLSGTYVRDYLLDPDPVKADANRRKLEGARAEMGSALLAYGRRLTASEALPYRTLQEKLASYWRTLAPATQWSPQERERRGYAFLRDAVFPQRTAMLSVADQIEALNEKQLNQGAAQVAALFSDFELRLTITLFVTLCLGILLATLSMRRILRLGRESQERYVEIEKARTDLKELSARMVDAQESERRAISRELHDEVGQSLSALLIALSNLSAELPDPMPPALREQLHGIRELAEGNVRVVRNMALLLRPSMLDDLGLIPALRWQARQTARLCGIRVEVTEEDLTDDLRDDYKTCIYRVVQEALHNAGRHSGAGTVRVWVKQRPDSILVSIQDDGRGFSPLADRGLGLLGMNERVTHLEGHLQIDSHAGRGTLITIELPLI